jgi:ribonuclease-3
MTPQRLAQLVAFLQSLGLDPAAAGGPGPTAQGLAPIEEALSHSSLKEARSHERLEFLGDAVLRLAATEFLRREQPKLRLGEQSALRGHLVSDRWLTKVGQDCGLEEVIRLGPTASGDGAGRATVLAECTEALIGGIYLAWGGPAGGIEPVIHWLRPYWQSTTEMVLADPHRNNWKSALQEWSQSQGLGLPIYQCTEQSLAHGDSKRFHCRVEIHNSNLGLSGRPPTRNDSLQIKTPEDSSIPRGEGWGSSRKNAEQSAACQLLNWLALHYC